VRLGGRNVYGDRVEDRPVLGSSGRPPAQGDIARAVRLERAVSAAATGLAVLTAAGLAGRSRRRDRASEQRARSERLWP
jgi:adenosylcobinamide-phosphate synthase